MDGQRSGNRLIGAKSGLAGFICMQDLPDLPNYIIPLVDPLLTPIDHHIKSEAQRRGFVWTHCAPLFMCLVDPLCS